MKNFKNEIYTLVDEEYLSKFSQNHLSFMKKVYYDFYQNACKVTGRKKQFKKDFFKNMHYKRFQLFQLCCPYCGSIDIFLHDKKLSKKPGYNYCVNCGKGSAFDNIQTQISRFIRIRNIQAIGLTVLKEKHPQKEDWLIGFDCYQMELIELASIIEVVFRDYFEALLFINNLGIKNEYISLVVNKYTSNDFMNIEKANIDYKRAFGIDLKKELDKKRWIDLIDIVNLRNMMIHNNGIADDRFKKTSTYKRLEDKFAGGLLKLGNNDVGLYAKSVASAIVDISNLYLKCYYDKQNIVVANHYFNAHIAKE